MKPEIAASMMCADFMNLRCDLDALSQAGIEYLHFDIMDGMFVPNYTLGPCFLNRIRDHTEITYDIHMMVERPEEKLKYFDVREGDIVSIHYEATCHVQRVLSDIRQRKARPGVAINPGTPVSMLEDILEDMDFVLVMTVNPGFAGQKLVPHAIEKIKRTRRFLDEHGFGEIQIQVDGNVSFENAKKMRAAGADIFVAGTSGLFLENMNICEAAAILRHSLDTV